MGTPTAVEHPFLNLGCPLGVSTPHPGEERARGDCGGQGSGSSYAGAAPGGVLPSSTALLWLSIGFPASFIEL